MIFPGITIHLGTDYGMYSCTIRLAFVSPFLAKNSQKGQKQFWTILNAYETCFDMENGKVCLDLDKNGKVCFVLYKKYAKLLIKTSKLDSYDIHSDWSLN